MQKSRVLESWLTSKVSLMDLKIFLILTAYKLLLDFSYDKIISVSYDYQYFYNDSSPFSIFFSWAIFLIMSPLIIFTYRRGDFSSSVIFILCCVSFVPLTTAIEFNADYSLKYVLLVSMFWFILLISNSFIPTIKLARTLDFTSDRIYLITALVFVTSILFVSWKFTGFRLHFGLMDVYDIRAEARDYDVNVLLGYVLTFSDNILPVLMIFFFVTRRKLIALFCLGVILFNFGITASKSLIFLPFLGILGLIFVRSTKFLRLIITGLITIVLACVVEFLVFDSSLLSFLLYRIFFIPAKLHYVYYDFFSIRELDFFRQSIFKWFLDSPYDVGIGFLIGGHDIGDFTARANNGLFSEAFMNLGTVGVILWPAIIIFILKILEGSVQGFDPRVIFIVILAVSFVLISLPLTTAFLSGGIAAMIILFTTMPKSNILKSTNDE